jgi:tetratricopeptide (TPR) repeat protein
MSNNEEAEEKKDPIKIHREGTALSDVGKHEEAMEKFLEASELYEKAGNFFDASYTLFKAAECNYLLKNYSTATERFLKAADLAFKVGYDRFGLSALEYVLDCYKATGEKEEKAEEIRKKIKEVKEKLSAL